MTESQKQYLSLHKELDTLREGGTTTSDRKVFIISIIVPIVVKALAKCHFFAFH